MAPETNTELTPEQKAVQAGRDAEIARMLNDFPQYASQIEEGRISGSPMLLVVVNARAKEDPKYDEADDDGKRKIFEAKMAEIVHEQETKGSIPKGEKGMAVGTIDANVQGPDKVARVAGVEYDQKQPAETLGKAEPLDLHNENGTLMVFPKPVRLTVADKFNQQKILEYHSGINRVPDELLDHSWLKLNGVTKYEPKQVEVPAAQPGNAPKTAKQEDKK